MKRVFCLFLCIGLLLTMVACSTAPVETKTESKEEDLSALSAQRLYEVAVSRTQGLPAVFWRTEIEYGSEKDVIESARTKKGYDGFSYACSWQGNEIWYDEGKAYLKWGEETYTAPASTRQFQECVDRFLLPVGCFSSQGVTSFSRQGLEIRYELTSQVLDRVAKIYGEKLVPQSGSGVATVDEKGILTKETVTLVGTYEGQEFQAVMTTETRVQEGKTLAEMMNSEKPKEESCIAISDISLPMLMTEAVNLLSQREELDLTLFSSQSVKVGENSFLSYEENTLQQKSAKEYLFSRNTLKKSPAGEENKVMQERFASSAGVKVVYDLISGEKTEESTFAAAASPWPALMAEQVLPVNQLSAPALEVGAEADTVTFSLSGEVAYGLIRKMATATEGNGLNVAGFSATASGVLTISHKTGEMTAFSLSVQANCASGPISLQLSLTVNQTEGVQVPEIQPLTFYSESTHD